MTLTAEQLRDKRHELQVLAKGRRCIKCRTQPRVAWFGEAGWQLRCECYPNGPKLQRDHSNNLIGRYGDMMAKQAEQVGGLVQSEIGYTSHELAPMSPDRMMTPEEFLNRQRLIELVVGQMVEGVHFGLIPGTKDKSLWEPGAEYLRAAFNIAWDYDIIENYEDFNGLEFRYTVRAYHVFKNGARLGGWQARAWSKEQRFLQNSPDLANTVMDRAIKRAFVNLIRNVTGTSGYFKQALDATTGEVVIAHDHYCKEHKAKFYKTGRMKSWGHKIAETDIWCNEGTVTVSGTPAPGGNTAEGVIAYGGGGSDALKAKFFELVNTKGVKPPHLKNWFMKNFAPAESYDQVPLTERERCVGLMEQHEAVKA